MTIRKAYVMEEGWIGPLVDTLLLLMGTGVITAAVTNWFTKRKIASEAARNNAEASQISVRTALELEAHVRERYKEAREGLAMAEKSLTDALRELGVARLRLDHDEIYIEYLQAQLAVNSITFTQYEDYIKTYLAGAGI